MCVCRKNETLGRVCGAELRFDANESESVAKAATIIAALGIAANSAYNIIWPRPSVCLRIISCCNGRVQTVKNISERARRRCRRRRLCI